MVICIAQTKLQISFSLYIYICYKPYLLFMNIFNIYIIPFKTLKLQINAHRCCPKRLDVFMASGGPFIFVLKEDLTAPAWSREPPWSLEPPWRRENPQRERSLHQQPLALFSPRFLSLEVSGCVQLCLQRLLTTQGSFDICSTPLIKR